MNALTNMRTTHDIDNMTIDEIAAMPFEELRALYDSNLDALLNAQTRKKKMTSAMHQRIDANTLGTTKKDGIKITIPKSVKWDIAGLDALRKQIAESGANPAAYITEVRTLKVSETAYDGWTPDIKEQFKPLRTVKPGSPKVEFYDV